MTGPILLQGAMDVETGRTAALLEDRREETIGGFQFWRGRYAGLDLVVSRTEVGTVSAAAATAQGMAARREGLSRQPLRAWHTRALAAVGRKNSRLMPWAVR